MSNMKIWVFQVSGAGDNYRLTIQDTNEKSARAQAATIVGKGRALALVRREVGDLNDFLGEDYPARYAQRKRGMKNLNLWKGN